MPKSALPTDSSRELAAETAALNALAHALGAPDAAAAAERLLTGLQGILGVSGGLVVSREGEGGGVLASRGVPADWAASWEVSDPDELGTRLQAGRVTESLEEGPERVDATLKEAGIQTVWAVPLGEREDPAGALVLVGNEEGAFVDGERDALVAVANAFGSWLQLREATSSAAAEEDAPSPEDPEAPGSSETEDRLDVPSKTDGGVGAALSRQPDLAVIRTDAEGRIFDWPETAVGMLGWTEEEATGRCLDFVLSDDDRAAFVRRLREPEIDPAGEWRVSLTTKRAESLACGLRLLFAQDSNEVVALVRSRRGDEASERWLRWSRALISVLDVSTLVLDPGGRIRELGGGWTSRGSTAPLRPESLRAEGRHTATRDDDDRVRRRQTGHVQVEVRSPVREWLSEDDRQADRDRAGGRRLLTLKTAPRRPIRGASNEEGSMSAMPSDGEKLRKQLEYARKMEAIGTLAGGIAHDFNNLLMAIQGNVALVLEDLDASHSHHRLLRNVEAQVESGARLTSQLLGYARKGRYSIQPLDLNRLVDDAAHTFGRTRRAIRIDCRLGRDLPPVEADRGQIEQVLLNLLVNASDAMPDGGDLRLETAEASPDEIRGEFRPRAGRYVALRITDSGVGVAPAIRERVFEPFFSTKEMGHGTGLGLASVYGIVKGHGGYVVVDSEPGRGSTFSVFLPVAVRTRKAPDDPDRRVSRDGGVILLVDDESVVLDVGAKMLERLGYEVIRAGGGREALAVFEREHERIDVVILDLIMPDMGGRRASSKPFARSTPTCGSCSRAATAVRTAPPTCSNVAATGSSRNRSVSRPAVAINPCAARRGLIAGEVGFAMTALRNARMRLRGLTRILQDASADSIDVRPPRRGDRARSRRPRRERSTGPTPTTER